MSACSCLHVHASRCSRQAYQNAQKACWSKNLHVCVQVMARREVRGEAGRSRRGRARGRDSGLHAAAALFALAGPTAAVLWGPPGPLAAFAALALAVMVSLKLTSFAHYSVTMRCAPSTCLASSHSPTAHQIPYTETCKAHSACPM